jgi:hypothetical protein
MKTINFFRHLAIFLLGAFFCAQAYAEHTVKFLFIETVSVSLKEIMQTNATALFAEINRAYDENQSKLSLSTENVEASAIPRIQSLWNTSHFCSAESGDIIKRVLKSSNGYQVRNVSVIFEKSTKEGESDEQDIVIEFTPAGKISDISIALTWHQYAGIIGNSNIVSDGRHRQMLLELVENFRTAYNRKDLEFLNNIYGENALIITGKVITQRKEDSPFKYPEDEKKIIYVTQTKKQYIEKMERVFKNNSYINIKFDDIEVIRHEANHNIYGVTLKQSWNTSTYSDKGWLFLIFDYEDESKPTIWVRTWQPLFDENGNEVFYGPKDKITIYDFPFQINNKYLVMKKIYILLLVLSSTASVFSQTQTLQEFVVEPTENNRILYTDCRSDHGVLVFYSTIKNLKFEIPNTPTRLIKVSDYDTKNYRYVLCVLPTDESQYKNYFVKITAPGYKPEDALRVSSVYPGFGNAQHFKIAPKSNIVEIIVFDSDGYLLEGCRVGVKGTDYAIYGGNKGFYKIELPNSEPTTLVISHENYNDTKEITVTPGDQETVRLENQKGGVTGTLSNKKIYFRVFGGLSVAKQESDAWYYEENKSSNTGYYIGASVGFQFNKYLAFQPELLFVKKGNKGQAYTSNIYVNSSTGYAIRDVLVKSTMQLDYIEFPLNLACNIPTGKNGMFFIGAGPSVSYLLSGSLTLDPSKEGVTFNLDEDEKKFDLFEDDESILSRVDFGFNFFAGYQYKRIFVKVGHNWGLNNIATSKEEGDASFKNKYFNIAFGFRLYPK